MMDRGINRAIVVCHGPSLTGAGWGDWIDSHDLVIRMNNCSWQSEDDYGSQYDIGLYCPDQPFILDDPALPSLAWLLYRPLLWGQGGSDSVFLDGNEVVCPGTRGQTIVFDISRAIEKLWVLNYHPSRGTASAMWALLYTCAETVVLAGADKVSGHKGGAHHPEALCAAHPLTGSPDRHLWQKEGHFLASIARDMGKECVFV